MCLTAEKTRSYSLSTGDGAVLLEWLLTAFKFLKHLDLAKYDFLSTFSSKEQSQQGRSQLAVKKPPSPDRAEPVWPCVISTRLAVQPVSKLSHFFLGGEVPS